MSGQRAGRGRCTLRALASLLMASSFSRYVYIPLGGSQRGLLGTLFSTAMTFAFVSYWHGSYEDLWSWAALNWLGVTVESGVRRLLEKPRVRETLVSGSLAACVAGTAEQRGQAWEGWQTPHSLKRESSCRQFQCPCVSKKYDLGQVGRRQNPIVTRMVGWLDTGVNIVTIKA